jgi:hypothetical protein
MKRTASKKFRNIETEPMRPKQSMPAKSMFLFTIACSLILFSNAFVYAAMNADMDNDSDVDGKDLQLYIEQGLFSDMDAFAVAYGTPGATDTEGRWVPGSADTWQWQLSGTVNTSYEVDVYDIDLFDSPAALIQGLHDDGRRVVCYFSAGSYENWRPDSDAFDAADLGDALDGWPGERWLDIRSDNVRDIMKARLDLAVQKGCDGVEPDNVDGYSNATGIALTAADQLAYNRCLAQEAHRRHLAVALKNDVAQVDNLVDDFDFAVNEQCHEYDECSALIPFIAAGKPVFNAEYASRYVNNAGTRQNLCNDAQALGLRTLVLPLYLDDSFRYSCD